MGCTYTKNVPAKDFMRTCKLQGFLYTSPPVFIGKIIGTIDIGIDGNVYFAKRSFDGNLLNRHPCRLEYSNNILQLFYFNGKEYSMKELQLRNNSDICMTHKMRKYVLSKAVYNHEYFPKFVFTGHENYDLLRYLFSDESYAQNLN
jgi:hypothetical protein